MKARIPLLYGLLVFVVSCCGRNSSKQEAYESLDTVIRLYESGVDTIDAELLAPALDYFPSKGDASTKGRLWYHWGLISYYQGEYDKAIVSYEKALQQTRISGDRHLEGLVCRAMADTYNRTFNIREDTVYMRKAWLAFDAEEDSLYRAETALRLVGAFMNSREWDKAGALLQQVMPFCTRNRVLLGPCMNICASYQLNAPSGDPALAVRYFEMAEEAGFPLSDDKKCDWRIRPTACGTAWRGSTRKDCCSYTTASIAGIAWKERSSWPCPPWRSALPGRIPCCASRLRKQ